MMEGQSKEKKNEELLPGSSIIEKSRQNEPCEGDYSHEVIGNLSRYCSDGRVIGHRVASC